MLEANLKVQLKGYLERLTQPVEIVASVDDSDTSREMLELLNDIVSLSPLVKLDPTRDDAQLKPILELDLPLDELCEKLVCCANKAGGRDNITCLLVRAVA